MTLIHGYEGFGNRTEHCSCATQPTGKLSCARSAHDCSAGRDETQLREVLCPGSRHSRMGSAGDGTSWVATVTHRELPAFKVSSPLPGFYAKHSGGQNAHSAICCLRKEGKIGKDPETNFFCKHTLLPDGTWLLKEPSGQDTQHSAEIPAARAEFGHPFSSTDLSPGLGPVSSSPISLHFHPRTGGSTPKAQLPAF